MSEARRITFIHAHPDDIEMLAAGTAARLSEAGHHITFVTMTPGDCGTRDYSAEEIARIRRGEAAEAAKVIGADYICAEFRDMAIFNDDSSRRRVVELLRGLRPDIVVTASPADYHCDHEATSVLVRDACFALGAPNYATGNAEPLTWIPHLYFADSVEAVDREGRLITPDFVVDIEQQLETKRRMIECHESQREWLRKHHGMDDYVETMMSQSREQGARHSLKYAEGFRQYKQHPYPKSPLLIELLGAGVKVAYPAA